MEEEKVCGICHSRISMYSIATGRVLTVGGKLCHIACSQDKTIAEIEARMDGLDHDANWSVGFLERHRFDS